MGRQATGCAQWSESKGTWVAWITLKGGKRWPTPMTSLGLSPHEPGCACTPKAPCAARAAAIAQAALVSRRARDRGAVDAVSEETCDDYFDRWVRERERRGLRSTSSDCGRWKKWIAPHLGPKAMAAVTTRDLETFVATLDDAVRRAKLSWKTAIHVWGLVTKMFDDARRSKDLSLRVREDNPAREVRGPDRGHDKASAFLFPTELDALTARPPSPAGADVCTRSRYTRAFAPASSGRSSGPTSTPSRASSMSSAPSTTTPARRRARRRGAADACPSSPSCSPCSRPCARSRAATVRSSRACRTGASCRGCCAST